MSPEARRIGVSKGTVEMREHGGSYGRQAGTQGKAREVVKCPFCGADVVVFVRSFAEVGKNCECGAHLTHGGECYKQRQKTCRRSLAMFEDDNRPQAEPPAEDNDRAFRIGSCRSPRDIEGYLSVVSDVLDMRVAIDMDKTSRLQWEAGFVLALAEVPVSDDVDAYRRAGHQAGSKYLEGAKSSEG